ncbi:MAG: PQQ-binding-like beta-propeller repeat protein [Planctomycetales bacterium]|nr:PQQ-binding-like beta-propeller repeat protein [Planctomycetales bacterium]
MLHTRSLRWTLLFVLAATCQVSSAADWPQFLGPNRNGISAETGLIEAWPTGGLPEIWRSQVGVGMSGVAVIGDLAFTLTQTDGQQWCLALDAKTGRNRWKAALAPAYENQMGDGPRATPTIADGRVFVYTGEGILSALSADNGKLLWSHDLPKQFGGKPADYGMACSPLVVGGVVVVQVGAPQATVAAFDVASGKAAWNVGEDGCGYSSPTLLNVRGTQQIVAFSGGSALGIAPTAGKLLWRYPFETDYECNTATPIAAAGGVLISSGENHGSALLSVSPAGGAFDVGEQWTSFGAKSTLRSEWQTPILLDGYLYGFDNVGSAGPVTHLTCVDAKTGERVWQKTRFGKGNLIAADGKLFISTMNGELVVARATPEGYQELGRQELLDSTRQAPSLANGFLYLRDNREIVCVKAAR